MKGFFRKFIVTVVCLMVLLPTLSGCDSEKQTSGEGSQSEAITLTYSIWDKNQKPAMEAIAAAFHEKNPNITVNVEVTPWDQYWTKLDAGASSGTLPDIFWMHSRAFLKYANNDMLMDITDKLKNSKEVSLDNFPKDLVELYTVKGENYAIPKDYDTIALWYNKTMFDEKGIAYPDETWDWNKLLEVAQKLNDPAKGVYGFLSPVDTQQNFYDFIYQNGGTVLSADKKHSGYDSVATKEAIQFAVDFSQKYKVSPTVQQFADTSRDQYFESGRGAMAFFGSWMVSEFKANDYVVKNCDVAIIPFGKKKATVFNGLGNVISAKSKNQGAAWRFLEFLGTKEANTIQAEKVAAIPAYRGTEQPWIDNNKPFNVKVYPQMLEYGYIFPSSATRDKWDILETEIFSKVWAGEVSVEDGCNDIAKQMNNLLSTEK
jgi:multiple sugar transport system substrate-binding protein